MTNYRINWCLNSSDCVLLMADKSSQQNFNTSHRLNNFGCPTGRNRCPNCSKLQLLVIITMIKSLVRKLSQWRTMDEAFISVPADWKSEKVLLFHFYYQNRVQTEANALYKFVVWKMLTEAPKLVHITVLVTYCIYRRISNKTIDIGERTYLCSLLFGPLMSCFCFDFCPRCNILNHTPVNYVDPYI